MQQLRTLGEVADASRADPQCMWAAQRLTAGGVAWADGGAVVVGCPALSGRDRLIVRGPPGAAAGLVRAAIEVLGPTFVPIGDPSLMASLLAQNSWLVPGNLFGWMDGVRLTRREASHKVRWLARQEWPDVGRVLGAAFPDSYARPGVADVRRWAGVMADSGWLTSIAADAWSTPGIGFLAGVAVLPEVRRAGQGRDVCAFVLDALLAARGRVALMVGNSNEAAIRMYVGLGLSYRLQQVLRVERRPGGRGRPSVG